MGNNEFVGRSFTSLPNGRVSCDRSCEINGVFTNTTKGSDGRKNICVTNEGMSLSRGMGVSFSMNISCRNGVCALAEEKENKTKERRNWKDLVVSEAKYMIPRISGEAMDVLAGPMSSLFITMPDLAVFLTKIHLGVNYVLEKSIEVKKRAKSSKI